MQAGVKPCSLLGKVKGGGGERADYFGKDIPAIFLEAI